MRSHWEKLQIIQAGYFPRTATASRGFRLSSSALLRQAATIVRAVAKRTANAITEPTKRNLKSGEVNEASAI